MVKEYFSHDYHARGDKKLVKLLMDASISGVGVYWCVVEMLFEEEGYLMLTECERIAFELRTDSELVRKVIDSELFEKDEDKFWSKSVLERLNIRHEKSKKTSNSAKIRWDNEKGNAGNDANALQSDNESNAIKAKQSKANNKAKERKEKEIKINKSIRCYEKKQELEEAAAAEIKNVCSDISFFKFLGEERISYLAETMALKYFDKQPILNLKNLATEFLERDKGQFPAEYIEKKQKFDCPF